MEFSNWHAKHLHSKSDLCNLANSRPLIHITLQIHCMKSNTFSPPWEPPHSSKTELSRCHLLLWCGNTENHAWEKTVTLDWSETQLLIIDNPAEKKSSFCTKFATGSNRACLKNTWIVQIMNPVTDTECSKWQRYEYKQGKELKERKMMLLFLSLSLSTLNGFSLNGFSIHFTSVVQQFIHCPRSRNLSTWSHLKRVHPVLHYSGFQTARFREPKF